MYHMYLNIILSQCPMPISQSICCCNIHSYGFSVWSKEQVRDKNKSDSAGAVLSYLAVPGEVGWSTKYHLPAGPHWYSAAVFSLHSQYEIVLYLMTREEREERWREAWLLTCLFWCGSIERGLPAPAGPWSHLRSYRPHLVGQNEINLMGCCALIGWPGTTRAELLSTIILTLLLYYHLLPPSAGGLLSWSTKSY